MKTKITSILTIILITALPLSHAKAKTAQEIISSYRYDAGLGFSILFPPGWELFTTSLETIELYDLGTATSVDVGLPDIPDMMNIGKFEIEQWNNLSTVDTVNPTMIGVTDTHVIGYELTSAEHDYQDDIDWIINNITVHSNTLSDIEGDQNEAAIQYLLDTNVISGYPDGTFKPAQTINRAELMKIITEGSGITPSADEYSACFPDVTNEWFAVYVCYAKEQNWIQGYPDNTFKPDQNVNKVEALKMIINSQELSIPGAVNDELFDDVDNSAWYAPFVKTAKDKGMLEQEDGIYGVGDDITRGEVSENIYRALLLDTFEAYGMPESTEEEETSTEETTETPATIDGYALFTSESYLFTIEYPDQWYYAGSASEDENVVRLYEFGPGINEDESALISLEIRTGDAPDGTVIEMNSKTLILTEEGLTSNVYFKDEDSSRLYRLTGSSDYEEAMLSMASTIEKIESTE